MGTGLRVPRQPGLGFDAAGEVEAVGKDITRFKRGDAVFADLTQFGHSAFAEYAVAPSEPGHTPRAASAMKKRRLCHRRPSSRSRVSRAGAAYRLFGFERGCWLTGAGVAVRG